MKTLLKFGVGALLLIFFTSAFANKNEIKPLNAALKSKNTTVTSYIVHYALQDNGPSTDYPGEENYTLYSYVTDNVNTSYTDRITVSENIESYDTGGPEYYITILSGANYASLFIDGALPPHYEFGSDFPVSLNVSTYNGLPITADSTGVIYFSGPI